MAGRPPGSENKNKRFKAALIRYADAEPRRLDELAEKLWLRAMEGDVTAMKEVADRLDGRPPQAIVGDDDHPGVKLEAVQRTIVDPRPIGHTDSPGLPAPADNEPV
jgi:hypothetical protein